MEKQQFINTMIKEWGSDFDYLTLTFEDGDTATFGRSYIWVGGSEDEENGVVTYLEMSSMMISNIVSKR